MKKISFIKIIKHSLRLIISVILSIAVLYFFNFETFYNIILFTGIYIMVSIILELIFKKITP